MLFGKFLCEYVEVFIHLVLGIARRQRSMRMTENSTDSKFMMQVKVAVQM